MRKGYDRHALVAALNDVLEVWHAEHGMAGGALCALDALGYTAGAIFALAPDKIAADNSRIVFTTALEEGAQQNCTLH